MKLALHLWAVVDKKRIGLTHVFVPSNTYTKPLGTFLPLLVSVSSLLLMCVT